MKKTTNLILAVVFFLFIFGCGLTDRFKSGNNNSSNTTPGPAVSPSAAASPTPSVSPQNSAEEVIKNQKNFLAFGAGAMIADRSSEDHYKPARKLIDEAEGSSEAWFSAENQTANQYVTIELPAKTTLKNIVFDNNGFDYENRFAKEVSVEVSDVSAKDGFQKILDATLEKDKAGQLFVVANPVAGRFVRINFLSNFGSPKAVQLREIRGYGEQEPQTPFDKASGTYLQNGYEKIHLKQEGALITGCSESGKQIIKGTIEGRTINYIGKAPDENGKSFGVIQLAPDGKTYLGANWNDTYSEGKLFDNLSDGKKTDEKIGNCPQLPDLDGNKDAAKNDLKTSLEKSGRAILYGINFDFNSDQIKPESKPILEKVVAILKENTDWKMQIEGHTDNIGGEAFNKSLSEKRAASVVKYLTDAGIDSARLTSSGAGLSRPVAPNETEAGRAQNRRVELIKQ